MYYGDFASKEDICREFNISDFDGEVLYASYEYECYDGSANVLYIDGGKLFYVSGGHCSCYGLEDQWMPEELTLEMIKRFAANARGYGFWADKVFVESLVETIEAKLTKN